MRQIICWLLGLALLGLIGCTTQTSSADDNARKTVTDVSVAANETIVPNEIVDADLVARGVVVYRANYCGTCHTLGVAGTTGTFGPAHNDAGVVAAQYIELASYDGTARTAEEYLYESLINPSVFYTPGYEATNHHMPMFTHLSEDDLQALVYLLINQRGE